MSLLPRLLDLPGLILEGLLGSGRSPSFPRVSPRKAAAEVIQSTRANAFLALETDGVERYRVNGRVFGVARAGRASKVP